MAENLSNYRAVGTTASTDEKYAKNTITF